MLELDNRSDWAAGLYPGWNRNGERQLTVVVKMAYHFSATGRLSPQVPGADIEEADRYHGEPGLSSLAAACETVPFKEGGELLVNGTAQPPTEDTSVMEVALALRAADDCYWEKTLRLYGRRRWQKTLLGISASKPEPLEPLPLRYEYAYGGVDPNHAEQLCAENPVGCGYSQKGWRVNGMLLPQIEIGPKFISRPAQRVAPAGYGPVAPFWQPRLKVSGQLDESAVAWGGCPFTGEAAADLYNAAPMDQRFAAPFVGGETIRLKGLLADIVPSEGVLLQIPQPRVKINLVTGNRVDAVPAVCDTLSIDTDEKLLCLLWRAAVPFDLLQPQKGWIILRDLDLEENRHAPLEAS